MFHPPPATVEYKPISGAICVLPVMRSAFRRARGSATRLPTGGGARPKAILTASCPAASLDGGAPEVRDDSSETAIGHLPLGLASLATLGDGPRLRALSAAEVDETARQNAVLINSSGALTIRAPLSCPVGRRRKGHRPCFAALASLSASAPNVSAASWRSAFSTRRRVTSAMSVATDRVHRGTVSSGAVG